MPRHQQVTICKKTGGPTSKFCTCEHCTLSVCAVCGAWEGSLTTHCSGFLLSHDRRQEVYETDLDYTDERGWHQGLPMKRREPIFAPANGEPTKIVQLDARITLLQSELVQKAVAWARADRACDDQSATLTRLQDEVNERMPKGQEETWFTEANNNLLDQFEQAQLAFRIADHHVQKCDDEFRQTARRLADALDGGESQ